MVNLINKWKKQPKLISKEEDVIKNIIENYNKRASLS